MGGKKQRFDLASGSRKAGPENMGKRQGESLENE